ncbi:hypothetical protein [Leisingera caerulea]|uniref:hypothetical protein n=1 Tax=Leisingera caerulea TaxID=506591 RepID=UPI00040BF9AB|nr:hypothetical protein [Leisingera caerulea]
MTTEKKTLMLQPIAADAACADVFRRLCANMSDGRGLLLAWTHLQEAPEVFFGETLSLSSKEAYLAFRALLKEHIRFFAAEQRELAKAMRMPGGNEIAQTRRDTHKRTITKLIEVRRAGKVWSAGQAAARRAAQAA